MRKRKPCFEQSSKQGKFFNQMKILLHCCLWIVFIILCGACRLRTHLNTTDSLPGTWRLSDVSTMNTASRSGVSFEEEAKRKQMVKEGLMIALFEDGTYSELRGTDPLKTGKWKYKSEDEALYFMDPEKKTEPLPVRIEKNRYGKEMMTLQLKARRLELRLAKEAATLKDFTDDPFYATNNQWRIRPSKPESPEELTKRFANYLKHIALILKAAKERKQDIVSFEFSKGPIQIYNGGIGAYPYESIPQNWKACFYNEDDALKAYRLYEHYLRTTSYRGGGTGDWVEDDYNILLSIYAGLTQNSSKGLQ